MSARRLDRDALAAYVDHFRGRVLQDALAEATRGYWRQRAEALEAALPRPGDFTGRATSEELEARRAELVAAVLACRRRAAVSLVGGELA